MSNKAESAVQQQLLQEIEKIMRPIVRVSLQFGLPYQVLADALKEAFVRIAEAEFAVTNRRQTKSRLSVLTGLSRKEVLRVLNEERHADGASILRHNRVARVVTGWLKDPRFSADGKAMPLATDEGDNSFAELVRAYSGDIPVRAMLDELKYRGVIAINDSGLVEFRGYGRIWSVRNKDDLTLLGDAGSNLLSELVDNLNAGAATVVEAQSNINVPAGWAADPENAKWFEQKVAELRQGIEARAANGHGAATVQSASENSDRAADNNSGSLDRYSALTFVLRS